jgi:hypothetical protein|tara:strand:- start:156 stop:902 length:747 start_codon:yes stop_codon:yes gene_type:complete
MTKEMIPLQDIKQMAIVVAESKMFGIQTTEQAMSLMLIAQAEGMHPAKAAQEYHVIQGKPSLKSDAMLARFQAAGGKVNWVTMEDEKVVAEFSHPSGGSITIDWDMDRAKRAGLGGKGTWKQYPRQMLSARVISEGIRRVFPGATGSFYVKEEVEDFDVKPNLKARIEDAVVYDAEVVEVEPATGSDYAVRISTCDFIGELERIGAEIAGDPELFEAEVDILRTAYKEKKALLELEIATIEKEVSDAE